MAKFVRIKWDLDNRGYWELEEVNGIKEGDAVYIKNFPEVKMTLASFREGGATALLVYFDKNSEVCSFEADTYLIEKM